MKKYLLFIGISILVIGSFYGCTKDNVNGCNCNTQLQSSINCDGTNQNGANCNNNTLNSCGYCYLHTDQCK